MTTRQFHQLAMKTDEARRIKRAKQSEATSRHDAARILYRLAGQVDDDTALDMLISAAHYLSTNR